MKKQTLFTLMVFLGVSCLPLQASDKQENKQKTATGKSSWTICKGVAKILIGAPLAFGGLKGLLVSLPMAGIGAASGENQLALYGFAGTIISAGCVVGGGYLAYSGIQDLNDNEEESEVESTYA